MKPFQKFGIGVILILLPYGFGLTHFLVLFYGCIFAGLFVATKALNQLLED